MYKVICLYIIAVMKCNFKDCFFFGGRDPGRRKCQEPVEVVMLIDFRETEREGEKQRCDQPDPQHGHVPWNGACKLLV